MNEIDMRHEPLEELQAGLFFLMNEYAGDPCCCIAEKIATKMERIRKHPLIEIVPDLQGQYARCINRWRARACLEQGATARARIVH